MAHIIKFLSSPIGRMILALLPFYGIRLIIWLGEEASTSDRQMRRLKRHLIRTGQARERE